MPVSRDIWPQKYVLFLKKGLYFWRPLYICAGVKVHVLLVNAAGIPTVDSICIGVEKYVNQIKSNIYSSSATTTHADIYSTGIII
jgi:hypothetical protein